MASITILRLQPTYIDILWISGRIILVPRYLIGHNPPHPPNPPPPSHVADQEDAGMNILMISKFEKVIL